MPALLTSAASVRKRSPPRRRGAARRLRERCPRESPALVRRRPVSPDDGFRARRIVRVPGGDGESSRGDQLGDGGADTARGAGDIADLHESQYVAVERESRMTLDILGAVANIVTLFVVAVSAIAAVRQLRHYRDANQLQAILAVVADFKDVRLQAALRYVQVELPERMKDEAYRTEVIRIGFVDPEVHPEMQVCNWFNEMGTLLKNRLVDETTFLDLFHRLATYYWRLLSPTIALLRRNRGDWQYENFEYLAAAAQRWHDAHPHGTYPRATPRLPLPDPWLEAETQPSVP